MLNIISQNMNIKNVAVSETNGSTPISSEKKLPEFPESEDIASSDSLTASSNAESSSNRENFQWFSEKNTWPILNLNYLTY